GNFKAGNKQGTIMKKLCHSEEVAFDEIQKDLLRPFVPEYLGIVDGSDGEKYLQLQDLLSDFSSACVMDIKMGVRTYLEEELAKARHKPKLRKDMYEKMVQIDANAPSEAENRAKAVTKPRYMVWRETISSTATLGFRIEGIRRGDGTSSKDFKTTRTRDQVMTAIAGFVDGYPNAVINYINRLKEIRATLEKSKFFRSHELIGSSLLFVHNEEKSGVWLIDFAKTVPLPDSVTITHREPWVEGTHEDGYLIGLDNLINLMENLHMKSPVVTPNDSEICNPQVQGSIPDQIETSTPGNTEGHQQVLPDITEEKRVSEPELILSNNIKGKETNEDRKTSAIAEDLHIPVKKSSKNVTNVIERKVLDETRN
ncbi:Inositol-trisphosphate 3-kinase A, partial [Armadillidium vulgare]